MKTEYCPHCGAKHAYDAVAPKFCSSCGQPMGALQSSQATDPEKPGPKKLPPEDSPPNEESFSMPTKWEYTIEGKASPPVKLGDLLKEEPASDKISRKSSNKGNSLKESMTSCLSARRSEEIGE